MDKLLSKRAFACHAGVSREYIGRLIIEGVIPTHNGLIDPDEAIVAMDEARDPTMPEMRKSKRADSTGDPLEAKNYRDARLFKEKYAGLRIKLDYERARGDLIPAQEVLQAWQKLVANFRARCLALPSKLAPQLVGHDINFIKERITASIYEALEELSHNGSNGLQGRAI